MADGSTTHTVSYFRHVMRLKGREKPLKGKGKTSRSIGTQPTKKNFLSPFRDSCWHAKHSCSVPSTSQVETIGDRPT